MKFLNFSFKTVAVLLVAIVFSFLMPVAGAANPTPAPVEIKFEKASPPASSPITTATASPFRASERARFIDNHSSKQAATAARRGIRLSVFENKVAFREIDYPYSC